MIPFEYKVWIDYMVTQCYLKHSIPFQDITILTFDEFINAPDNFSPATLRGWYERFKKRIDLSK